MRKQEGFNILLWNAVGAANLSCRQAVLANEPVHRIGVQLEILRNLLGSHYLSHGWSPLLSTIPQRFSRVVKR